MFFEHFAACFDVGESAAVFVVECFEFAYAFAGGVFEEFFDGVPAGGVALAGFAAVVVFEDGDLGVEAF